MIRFGPSGNSESFYNAGYKSSVDMPKWLADMGLNAYEYQCNRGVRIGKEASGKIGEEALKHDIFLSIHAPYYVNMASPEEEKRENSKKHIIKTLNAAKWMGAKRIVVHVGSYSKVDKKWALYTVKKGLSQVIEEADNSGLGEITICPEILGKNNQLGSLEEILDLCKIDERLTPTVDFAHLHARGQGSLSSPADFESVLDILENSLGKERFKNLHCHFSRVEFTKGGEKKHWTMKDIQYGPEFSHLAEIILKKKMEPVIICESRGKMAEDALKMKKIYEKIKGGI
ncbi:TIM barrel protein [Herbivorax sp. ANBcel31]|uniref:TIM barrel protein n=1 Tax=Herbivorax sp. ANBcel31 TaxID=3069754 RepID=UPI0027B38C03|nr:TIM barrel protein [Herbivorax sp. ANBcel31]MDQ2085294.1 TIM barrel protein [Herbivorax sp. ANBcel31]